MSGHHYRVFGTAAGFVAIGWNARGISSLRLPERNARDAERAVTKRLPGAVPADPPVRIADVIADIRRYFAGEAVDFSVVPVDMGEQSAFFAQVYDHIRRLDRGETTTYGAIAKALGAGPEFARDVGQAMATNPVPLIVPCHRVLGAGGKVGGFSAPGGASTKARMLELEGVIVAPAGSPVKPAAQQASFGF